MDGWEATLLRYRPIGRKVSVIPTASTCRRRTRLRGQSSTAILILSLAVSAYVKVAGIASDSYVWLTWFTLVPLFVGIAFCRPFKSMLCGAFWGSALYACSMWRGHGFAPPVGMLAVVIGVPAFYTCIGSWVRSRIGYRPLVLGLAWVGVELTLGAAGWRDRAVVGLYAEGGIVHWIAGALGYVLVAFLVAYVSASFLSVLSCICALATRLRPVCGSAHATQCISQTFASFVLLVIRACRPRAPPASTRGYV